MERAPQSDRELVVLWTEDDENDRLMIALAIERAGRALRLMFVEDGEEAWQYLRGAGKYSDRKKFPLPDALVTDLKMPRCNGFELVQQVRGHEDFKCLPILVFSASDLTVDRRAAQRLGVDVYVTKPTGFGRWTSTIVELVDQAAAHLRVATP
jgi:CheY-like chemotaxis protein